MSITARDRRIVIVLVPLLVLLGYWFLLLSPKRHEAADAGQTLSKVEAQRDDAKGRADQLQAAKTSFASDYTALVRLGKAIPESVDMPSLIVQLDAAARGTGIHFNKIAAGDSSTPGSSSPSGGSQAPAAPGNGNGSQPANGGGAPAQSTPGKQAEGAVNNVNSANGQNQSNAAQQSGVGDTQTSTSTKQGGLSVGGGTSGGSGSSSGSSAASSCAPGLVCVPLTFEFTGHFFNLADFFHRLKRFVQVANHGILVRGRLLSVDTLKLTSDHDSFPGVTAEVGATVYLAPKQEGATAGATAGGPAQSTPTKGDSSTDAAPSSGSASPVAPAATATP